MVTIQLERATERDLDMASWRMHNSIGAGISELSNYGKCFGCTRVVHHRMAHLLRVAEHGKVAVALGDTVDPKGDLGDKLICEFCLKRQPELRPLARRHGYE